MKKKFVAQVLFLALATTPALAVIGGGDIPMTTKGGDVLFSHAAHVDKAGLKCQECHPQLFINPKQHKTATMEAMQGGASCGACHDGKTAFSVKGDCAKCHKK